MTNGACETSLPPHVVCPVCHGPFRVAGQRVWCRDCQREFASPDGIPDFLVGERFEDEPDESMWANEEQTGEFLAEGYLAPLLRRLHGDAPRRAPAVLSIGCGVGSEIEALTRRGYDAYGIDAGGRTAYWARRRWPDRYYRASATRLPFADETFDFLVMGCILPHIGVAGDTCETTPGFRAERQSAVREAIRVTRKGGHLLLSGPNRLFPVDFFHRPSRTSHRPRFHSPREDFLLSYRDYEELLVRAGGCASLTALPIDRYWGFFSSSRNRWGWLMQLPFKIYFKLLSSKPFLPLCRSAVNPWLVVLATR